MKRVALSFSAAVLVLSILFVGTPAAALTGSEFSFPNYSITDFLDDTISVFSEIAALGSETLTGLADYITENTFLGDAPLYSVFNIYFIICLTFIAVALLAALISAGVYAKKKKS